MGKKDTNVRMSLQTLRVLEAFLENPTAQLAGMDYGIGQPKQVLVPNT